MAAKGSNTSADVSFSLAIGPEGVVPTGCIPRKRGCAFPAAGVRVSHRSGLIWDIYQFEVEATIIRDLHWVSVQVDNNIYIYPFGILLVRSSGPCLCGYSATYIYNYIYSKTNTDSIEICNGCVCPSPAPLPFTFQKTGQTVSWYSLGCEDSIHSLLNGIDQYQSTQAKQCRAW